MSAFSLLWSSILRSSIWVKESKETRLVWVSILAMKDFEGIVRASVIGLADAAKVSVEECREALRVLTGPDPDDTSGVDEGRRLREVPGGWQVINHDLYRFSTEAKREFWRQSKATQREKQKLDAMTPEERQAYQKEYRKRRKRKAACEGAGAAIEEGLSEQKSVKEIPPID